MTPTYDARTVEACIDEIGKLWEEKQDNRDVPFTPTELAFSLRSLPVAAWTRERPTKAGWYALVPWPGARVQCVKLRSREGRLIVDGPDYHADTYKDALWLHLDPLLPPPPAVPPQDEEGK